ncbi:MAG: hypothetical protein LUE31_02920 [Lachnospiraceae bacterium]|nr:hypothetical protein [Lachnospiraceae bacterium]
MLDLIKTRCGIAAAVTVYDDDIQSYIEDALEDLKDSGVSSTLLTEEAPCVVTAVTLYVKAYLGNDRSDTEKYMNLYRQKAFRLMLKEADEETDEAVETEDTSETTDSSEAEEETSDTEESSEETVSDDAAEEEDA